jgi:hypothetical protein
VRECNGSHSSISRINYDGREEHRRVLGKGKDHVKGTDLGTTVSEF